MTRSELIRRYPHASSAFIRANTDSHAEPDRTRPCTLNEKSKDDGSRKIIHKTGTAKVDAASHPKFKVTVIVQISDNRRRDLDGNLTTILDCLCTSRRQLSMDTGNNGKI